MTQHQTNAKRRHAGFTLLEMVVVIAILTILLGVLIPNMRGFVRKSRLNTANSEAKVLYNSIQTLMQEYEFRERQMDESAFYGTAKSGTRTVFIKGNDGTITAATSSTGRTLGNFKYGSGADILGASLASADASSFGMRLSRLFTDYQSVAWAAYIEDYTVRGVFCAEEPGDHYVGGYPRRATLEVGEAGCEIPATISACSASDIQTYSASAWTPGT